MPLVIYNLKSLVWSEMGTISVTKGSLRDFAGGSWGAFLTIVMVPAGMKRFQRDTCIPFFDYHNIETMQLEFPWESHAGKRKWLKAVVSQELSSKKIFYLLLITCQTTLQEWLEPGEAGPATSGITHSLLSCVHVLPSYQSPEGGLEGEWTSLFVPFSNGATLTKLPFSTFLLYLKMVGGWFVRAATGQALALMLLSISFISVFLESESLKSLRLLIWAIHLARDNNQNTAWFKSCILRCFGFYHS